MKMIEAFARADQHVGKVFKCAPDARGYGYAETDLQGRTWAALPRGYYQDARRARAIRVAGYVLHFMGYGSIEDSHMQADWLAYCRHLGRARDIVRAAIETWER